jgi:hypothetical protein
MSVAQMMTPTLFGQWVRQSVLLGMDNDLDVRASLWACLLQSNARKNGCLNRGSLDT